MALFDADFDDRTLAHLAKLVHGFDLHSARR